MNTRMKTFAAAACGLLTLAAVAAEPYTWTGAAGSDWFSGANWDQNEVPGPDADVVVGTGSVLLTNATPDLASFTMSGGTLTFSNWTTRLSAAAVEIDGNAVVTLPPAYQDGQMSNRVWFACEAFELRENAEIDTDGKGYQGGRKASAEGDRKGHGPGALAGSNNPGPAAGHGGHGAGRLADSIYGDATAPLYSGSGGSGSSWGSGGHGGGAVLIEAADTVVIDGTISANAGNGITRAGGGSGGSVHIICRTISGGGLLSAAGGQSNYSDNGNAGGGGRIAVIYNTTNQAALPVPGIRFWAHGGTVLTEAEPGTLYFPDTRFLETDVWTHRGKWVNDSLCDYARDTLTIDRGWLRFSYDGFTLTVTNALTLAGDGSIAPSYGWRYRHAGRLDLFGGRLIVGGDLVASNTATCMMFPGTNRTDVSVGGDFLMSQEAQTTLYTMPTNGVTFEYGARLSVTGLLSTATGSWLFPVSDWTNGSSVFMWAGSVLLGEGSGINADRCGWGNDPKTYDLGLNYGPGRGGYSMGGGGYGGRGGTSLGGQPYGSSQDPREPGSAGADNAANGGYGGGLVRLTVADGVTINGTITANGQDGGIVSNVRRSGGGSGGGVYISCSWIAGTNGMVMADGGRGHNSAYSSGGGGGGRIAVHYNPAQQDALPLPTIHFSARGGRGTYLPLLNRDDLDGDLGTLYFSDSRFLTEPIRHSGVWLAPGLTNMFTADRLVISNQWIRFPAAGFGVRVTHDLVVTDNGRLDLYNGELRCGGSVTLTNKGTLTLFGDLPDGAAPLMRVAGNCSLADRSFFNVYGVPTNGTEVYGARIEVGGRLALGTNCWIWPFSNPTNSGSPRFYVGELDIANPQSGFNANGRGCAGGSTIGENPGYGIGGGKVQRSGGGYGGNGGAFVADGPHGSVYGSLTHPTDPGSGGAGTSAGSSPGGAGGGLIWIYAERNARIEGQCVAEGIGSQSLGYNGGGSGGGIFIRCSRLSGGGYLSVGGGNGGSHSSHGGGSGGGGRIALWRMADTSSFSSNIVAGTAITEVRTGEEGTYFVGTLPPPATILLLR